MYERNELEAVRGMRDHLPDAQEHLLATRARLEEQLDAWGYQPIDLPILEHRELYLKKGGEELAGKLYDFVHQGRGLALRPEWTASVLRAYLKNMQSEPLPVRLRYTGPVFRYERPKRGTYRQFTQVGVELIGGTSPRADAEVVALACKGLRAAGVDDWVLTIGHVGIARALLAGLGLPERTASQLLWSAERLRRNGVDAVRAQFRENQDDTFDLGPLASLPDEQLAELLATAVRAMGLSLDSSSRSPEAIIQRLMSKLRRGGSQEGIDQALHSLERLSHARGSPEHALMTAQALFQDLSLPAAHLAQLAQIVDLVAAQGIDPPRLVVDLGLSRGLHYYSGMIFEIEASDGLQLCGGGRYDDLLTALQPGSRIRADVPAAGFAYGLERVTMASPATPPKPKSAVMVAAEEGAYATAMRTAETLRARGFRVLLDVRGRSLQAALRDAERRSCRFFLVIDQGDAGETAEWHDLQQSYQPARRRPLGEVLEVLQEANSDDHA